MFCLYHGKRNPDLLRYNNTKFNLVVAMHLINDGNVVHGYF